MRVAMVTQSYYPSLGGVTEHVHNLSRALRRLGCEVTIITSGPNREHDPSIIRVGINMPFPINGAIVNVTVGVDLVRRLQSILSKGFDVIHIHCPLEPTLPLAALMATRRVDSPVVGTFHMAARISPAYEVFGGILRKYARRLNVRIAVSQAARRFAMRYFPGTYTVIPNGVDFERFSQADQTVRELDDGKINFLYVGRFDPRKQVPALIQAFKRMAAERGDCRLVLVGNGVTYPGCLAAAGLMVGRKIIFVGRVQPEVLPAYYHSADVFCSIPTGSESFGIVLLEAMAAGKPVIASDIDGYREIVTSGREGILVRPDDKAAVARAMAELASDSKLRARMGQYGSERAKQYDWQLIARRIYRIYQEVSSTPCFRGQNGSITGIAVV